MYCKNCGNPMDPGVEICGFCNCIKGTGLSYCAYCGRPVDPQSPVCLCCGSPLRQDSGAKPKRKLIAGLLGIFLGVFGAQNFYLGFTGKAMAQLLMPLLTCGVLAPVSIIWGIVEAIQYLSGARRTDARGICLR